MLPRSGRSTPDFSGCRRQSAGRKCVRPAWAITDGVKVEWRKLRVFLQDEDGERDIVVGDVTKKEAWVCIQGVDHEKVFALGQRISFSAQEFADITWGLFVFGSDLVRRIGEVGIAKGLVKPAAVAAESGKG